MQTVSQVMTRGIRTMAPQDTVTAAAQAMRELDVGALPVCDGVRLVGMVTDRDIVVRGVAQERVDAPLAEVMSEGLLYCREDDSVESALASMRSQQVRRLPVLSREKRLVGIIALGDIAQADHDDTSPAGVAISGVSEQGHGAQA